MKKFMYINDVGVGQILINTDLIEYIFRDARIIRMHDGRNFIVKESELNEILTELERR